MGIELRWVGMEKDRRLELIDLAIQKLINSDQVQHDNNNHLKDHDAQYQLALSHLLSASQLEIIKKDETVNQSEASGPSSDSVNKKTENENCDSGREVDDGCKSSENDEIIIKELKKVKRQNFVTHCLLSVMIVLTMAWQLSEVSLILRVKEGINNPFRSFGNMIKGIVKDKVPDINGNGREADHNKQNNGNGSSSLPSFKIPEMPHMDVPNLGKE